MPYARLRFGDTEISKTGMIPFFSELIKSYPQYLYYGVYCLLISNEISFKWAASKKVGRLQEGSRLHGGEKTGAGVWLHHIQPGVNIPEPQFPYLEDGDDVGGTSSLTEVLRNEVSWESHNCQVMWPFHPCSHPTSRVWHGPSHCTLAPTKQSLFLDRSSFASWGKWTHFKSTLLIFLLFFLCFSQGSTCILYIWGYKPFGYHLICC